MQIEKLSKELKAIRKLKSDEYGPFNKKMQDIADVWSVLIGKKLRPHQVALMYAMAKQTTNTNTIVILMQSTTWFKRMKFTEKMSQNWSIATFQQQRKAMSLYEFKLEMEFCGYNSDRAEHFYEVYIDELQKKISE